MSCRRSMSSNRKPRKRSSGGSNSHSTGREDRVRAVAFEQSGPSLGLVGGLTPFLLEVGDADVAGTVPVAARLTRQGADDPALAGPAVALGDDVAVSRDP